MLGRLKPGLQRRVLLNRVLVIHIARENGFALSGPESPTRPAEE